MTTEKSKNIFPEILLEMPSLTQFWLLRTMKPDLGGQAARGQAGHIWGRATQGFHAHAHTQEQCCTAMEK